MRNEVLNEFFLWGDDWQPGDTVEFLVSVVFVTGLTAIFVSWLFMVEVDVPLTSLEIRHYVLGLGFGGGLVICSLAIYARPAWRRRWRSSRLVRALVAAPVGGSMGLLVSEMPAVAGVTLVVIAVVHVVGRTYLYLSARSAI